MPYNLVELSFISFGLYNTKPTIKMRSSKIINVINLVLVVIISSIDKSNTNGK